MRASLSLVIRTAVLTAAFLPAAAFAASASSASSSSSSSVVLKSTEHLRGRINAPITLVEYADFQCPFCQAHHETMKKLMRKYRSKVSWMYRHFPLEFHPHAKSAAEASECIASLKGNNAFWDFADALMTKKKFSPADYKPLAVKMGVDGKQFSECMERGLFAKKVSDQLKGGQAAGVEGTPTVFIVNRKGRYQESVVGAQTIDQYTAIIDRMLEELHDQSVRIP